MPLGSFRLNTLGNNAAPVNNNQGWILTMTPDSGTSYATSIDVDGANNVYFTGYNNTAHLIYAMKTNSSGNIVNLDRVAEWKSHDLDWDTSNTNAANTVVFGRFDRDGNK